MDDPQAWSPPLMCGGEGEGRGGGEEEERRRGGGEGRRGEYINTFMIIH